MGMTLEQFWDEPPFLASVYRDAYRIRRKTENEQAWIQGLYFYDALAVCMANVFSKKGAKRQDYVDHPFDIFPLTDEEKAQREQEEYKKMGEVLRAMQQKQRNMKKGD